MSTLESASKYLNNLLLARGLLRDGKSIDFANAEDLCNRGEASITRTINLVHDLVLRRDREAERYESMAESIRNLRASESQHVLSIQQMQDKHQQLQNDFTTSQAQERAAKASAKRLENQMKELKDQNAKMKSMLDQVRAKCTSDIRKRDVEIEKLKGHLISVQRGKKESGGMKIRTLSTQISLLSRKQCTQHNSANQDWSLEKETNDFLAAIVNETSAENVSLRQVIDSTFDVLQDMSSYEEERQAEEEDGIGIPGKYRRSRQPASSTITPVPVLVEKMDSVLNHCRTILRDPSFVPIEEVQVRDEEIAKLRVGWEKMADRWKEAVTMMSQWKQRMQSEGRQIDMEELSDLSFGRSIATRPDGQPVLGFNYDLSSIYEESKIDEFEDHSCHDVILNEELESDLELEPEPAFKRLASSPAKRGVRLPQVNRPLSEKGTNIPTPRGDRFPAKKSPLCSKTDGEDVSIKLTIKQKLAAVEAEAAMAIEQSGRAVTRKRKTQERQGWKRKSGLRRETLSPEELEALMANQ